MTRRIYNALGLKALLTINNILIKIQSVCENWCSTTRSN